MKGKLGIHSLVFTDEWTEANARAACETAKEIGFDLIEVLIFDPASLDVGMTKRVIADSGLELRLGMALPASADISSDDATVAGAGEAMVRRCLDIAAELGAPGVSGITYAAFNNYAAPPSPAQRERVAKALSRLDAHAGESGLRLGIEPVNRYESHMVNSLDQAAELIRMAGGRNLFIHMDTFHMNVEEADIAGAIGRNASLLGYAHVADNHRGEVGAGTYDWTTYFRSLAGAGYTGDFTIESFSSKVLGPDLVGGVSLWRQGWDDPGSVARRSFEFLRSSIALANKAVEPWR
jgi:D-psicose/D-tagatose/L-ribulose 3-epimerase